MAEYREEHHKRTVFLMERIPVVFKTQFFLLLLQNSPKRRFPGILGKSKRKTRDKR